MNESSELPRALLAAKLNSPITTPSQVTRKSICDLICSAQSVKLILVRAPAGFGKTTAMLQSRAKLEESGVDTAWMTLDRGDNDVSRFLSCLTAAVANITDGLSSHVGPKSLKTGFSLGDMALDIMDRLAAHTSPFALFLDDFELIREPAVLGLMREIIDHLPRCGQLIIGSRGLPDLLLGRLRARGQLLEIDADKLRFSMDETVEYFNQRRHQILPLEDVSQLHRKTEGWIAALWLASIALERPEGHTEFIARFSGSNQAVADYLADDVLARQPASIRDFLLRTSILRDLNTPLCNALSTDASGIDFLDQLDAANLFLVHIEGEDKTYRYHRLFADFLRAQLAREMPDEIPRLHRAASQWYESQGRPVPAIDHAIEGGDYQHALSLLSLHAESLLGQGRMRLLFRWFNSLPENILSGYPRLAVIQVWAWCLTRGPREAMALLESSGCADSTDPEVQPHVLALRPALLSLMDRAEDAYAVGSESLKHLPTAKPFVDSILKNSMAELFAIMGQYDESHKLRDASRRLQGERDNAFNQMYSDSLEGVFDLERGRLRQATARFRMAVSPRRTVTYGHANGNAWAGVLYAGALYEVNNFAQAEPLLNVYVPLAKEVALVDHMITGYIMLSRIAFCCGDVDRALQILAELEYTGHHRQLARVVTSAKLERARALLLQGNSHASKEELERANDPQIWERVRRLHLPAHDLEYIELGQLRWEIAFGDARKILPRLEDEVTAASAATRHRRALKLRVLQSLALHRSGDQRAALAVMGEVLKFACTEGFMRIILDEGDAVGTLVRQFDTMRREDGSDFRHPIFTEYLQRLMNGFGPLSDTERGAVTSAHIEKLLEPLTRKEIRVLQLLAEGYSNIGMAEKLFVSDSTVRTHLRNINSKLNAQSRTQAVAIARQLGLIR